MTSVTQTKAGVASTDSSGNNEPSRELASAADR
jgi:hypothetical protein